MLEHRCKVQYDSTAARILTPNRDAGLTASSKPCATCGSSLTRSTDRPEVKTRVWSTRMMTKQQVEARWLAHSTCHVAWLGSGGWLGFCMWYENSAAVCVAAKRVARRAHQVLSLLPYETMLGIQNIGCSGEVVPVILNLYFQVTKCFQEDFQEFLFHTVPMLLCNMTTVYSGSFVSYSFSFIFFCTEILTFMFHLEVSNAGRRNNAICTIPDRLNVIRYAEPILPTLSETCCKEKKYRSGNMCLETSIYTRRFLRYMLS